MQWPPTKPGLKGRKFHFVLAALITSKVSIFKFLKTFDNSFTNAIFKSLCVFSITFAASAILIEEVLKVPASMIHKVYQSN